MKRTTFAGLLLFLMIALWCVAYPFCEELIYWLGIPVLVAGLFGVYSLLSILKSVFTLKDYPSEEQSLHYDIGRAKQFYKEKGL